MAESAGILLQSHQKLKQNSTMLRLKICCCSLLLLALNAKGQQNEDTTSAELPTIVLDIDNLNADDDISISFGQSASRLSLTVEDQFLPIAGLTFSSYRFRPRGLNRVDNYKLQVNGILLADLERGYSSYSKLGGLNNVLRDKTVTYGLSPSGYAFGGLNGTTYMDVTAANLRKGTTVSYMNTNRLYRNRVMVTHNSGLTKDGWAYSLSVNKRWAEEGYIPGSFYDGHAVYGGISKVLGKGILSVSAIAAPTKRATGFYAIQETFDLASDNQYSSSWGYQEGKKRNAAAVEVLQPVAIANYSYKPNEKTRWNTAFGYEFGKYKKSGIDFYNAYNPYPDYYRNLPSYYLNYITPQVKAADAVRAHIMANPDLLQINWEGLYNSNYMNIETIKDVNGVAGNEVTGKRSLYVVNNRVDDIKKYSFNTNVEHAYNEHMNLYGGVSLVSQSNRYYKELIDLMGGDFYLNYNQFANQTNVKAPEFNQNDLNNPNKLIRVGDAYGYDYSINILKSDAWGQAAFYNKDFNFFAAAGAGTNSFFRTGHMKNGLFANNSYGKSETHSFTTYRVKGGITWKADANNSFYVNGGYITDAPLPNNTYVSPRTRDFLISNPVTQKTQTAEAGYIYRSRSIYIRATGYATDVKDAVLNKSFFNDDPAVLSFVNYIMSGVNTRSIGTEFSSTFKITDAWSINGIAAIGQSFYTNNPDVFLFQDNQPNQVSIPRTVYIKNYYLSVGPQSIYCAAVNYRAHNWTARVNFNYTDRNYVDINPDRRRQEALDLVPKDSKQWKDILEQEVLPSAFTVDLNLSKSFRLPKPFKSMVHHPRIYTYAGVTNVLNKTDIRIVGFEQLRYDYTLKSEDKFPNRYQYAFGINYYAGLTIQF